MKFFPHFSTALRAVSNDLRNETGWLERPPDLLAQDMEIVDSLKAFCVLSQLGL